MYLLLTDVRHGRGVGFVRGHARRGDGQKPDFPYACTAGRGRGEGTLGPNDPWSRVID